MTFKFLAVAAVVALGLSACTSSGRSGAISALPPGLSSGVRVASVTLGNVPGNASGGFRHTFQTEVQSALAECATGEQPLTLEVNLQGFAAPNAAMALFAPMKSEISGVARLRDAGGAVVGEYRIERSLMIGGAAGAIVHTSAERNMSRAFGEELCEQAF